jgi:dGTPase
VRAEVILLKTMALQYIYSNQMHLAIQQGQRDRILRVADYLMGASPSNIDPLYSPAYLAADSDAVRLRVVVDQIASMTETRLERLDQKVLEG